MNSFSDHQKCSQNFKCTEPVQFNKTAKKYYADH